MATLTAAQVTRVWQQGDGRVYAADVTCNGGRFSMRLARGSVTWAEPDVWAFPERFGLVRYYCPGHNGHVCYYGACDEIRYAGELAALLPAVAAALGAQHREMGADPFGDLADGGSAALMDALGETGPTTAANHAARVALCEAYADGYAG